MPSFAGQAKKSTWAVWNVLPELTEASVLEFIPGDVLHIIERFASWPMTGHPHAQTDKARRKLLTKKHDVQLIPPTKVALEEHVKRAAYQAGHVWDQTLLPAPVLLPATSWGWIKGREGVYKPQWTSLPEAAHSCCEPLSCKCKKGCVKHCKCKKAALDCTALCQCEGECTKN